MSALDLDAIRARADAATDGPWAVGERKELDGLVEVYELTIHSPSTNEEQPDVPDELAVIRYNAAGFQFPHGDARTDAEFIAAAREDVPALLAKVERLRASETELLAALAEANRSRASMIDMTRALIAKVDRLRAELAKADDAVWVEAPGPATTWDAHCATAMAALTPDDDALPNPDRKES